ncbi:MAG: TonB-dependent receptor [Pseudomonadales bacterium]|nr:TonB-dependent receptor [Pseudomonadales bacterium]
MRFSKLICVQCCLLFCLTVNFSFADEPVELDTIEVYGQQENEQKKYLDESFYETYSRDKITNKELKEEMATDVKSALRDIPNVNVIDSGAFSKRVEIRGLSGDRITYLVDDVVIGNQGMTHSGGGEINLLDIGRVDSIEVIKGSPSVIYSPGATGGIVNVTTKNIETDNHIGGAVEVAYDGGYAQDRESAVLSAGYKGFGATISASRLNARDYKIEDQEKLDEIILRTNVLDERLGTENEITDLGYNSESAGLKLKYQINAQHDLTAEYSEYAAEDISFTHGAATDRVFHYDDLSREVGQIGYHFVNRGNSRLSVTLYNQTLIKDIYQGEAVNRTLLDSVGLNLKGSLYFDESILRVGAEYVFDDAETNTFSQQTYYAAYASYEFSYGEQFTYTAGLRLNRWEVEQTLRPGQNLSIIDDLVGVSGKLDPQTDEALTYAAGVIYSINDQNNLSFNYSHTHRAPTLMERFAFDVFIGGGMELDAESANNIELGWKYSNDTWYASAAVFYSRFDNYISTKEVRKITDKNALLACIAAGDCNPLIGEYDDRESDFFATKVLYINAGEVDNRGFEFSLRKIINDDIEAGFSFGMNDFSAAELDFITDSRPLEFSGYYKKYFSGMPGSPWINARARYVTDQPNVEQTEGFDPFLVADIYAGGSHKGFGFSIGIRNLFNTVYHEPYTALDGLKRSFLVTVRYDTN